MVADLADVRTGEGEAHVPKPPRVTTLVRVGTVPAALRMVGPAMTPASHSPKSLDAHLIRGYALDVGGLGLTGS